MAPIIIERRPDDVTPPKTSTPTSPISPRAVRFPSSSSVVTSVSRPPSTVEAWSMYHFEIHARSCPSCFDPYEVHRTGRRLCDEGHGLAQDVAIHVYYKDGNVYSATDDKYRVVRVELPTGYGQVRGLLRAMERKLRYQAPSPIISHDRTYYIPSRRTEERTTKVEVIMESERKEVRSKHRPRYQPRVVEWPAERSTFTAKDVEKRGSLYVKDMELQRQVQQSYTIEIREPQKKKERKKEEYHR
ncbi:hypothetical protein LTR66_004172 [Elasticomyces elasticus]|nr:hypothetical protein LTR66_004172 [Elasticomyces elasticus]KAK5011106.1 hypothetical protein LTR28_005688 [Elasticomyces elasticus]